MLSEAEAWELIADFWILNRRMNRYGDWYVHMQHRTFFCTITSLCSAIQYIESRELITPGTGHWMFHRIHEERKSMRSAGAWTVNGYLWSHSKEGADARVQFCLRQARELRAEKVQEMPVGD